jgi:hypothetical protein
MSGLKDKGFGDRLSAAKDVRQAMAKKFLTRPAIDDPEVVARREERAKLAAERDARLRERKEERAAEKARIAAESEAKIKADAEEKAALEERAILDEATREQDAKAARDARYAARKARK